MTISINCNPGQTILLPLQILDSTGARVDGYVPTLDYIQDPDGYEIVSETTMTEVDIGLYKVEFTLPSGITAVGTYLASISYSDPDTEVIQYEVFAINCFLAFGVSSVAPA